MIDYALKTVCVLQKVFNHASLVIFFSLASLEIASANDDPPQAFSFGYSDKPKTIGDIKPAFIVYKADKAPDVSIKYVMNRYRKLFETATTPEVKIDALNRLNNLSVKYGIAEEKLAIDKYTQGAAILEAYDQITRSGEYYQRMDELLYQTAKATAFTGDSLETIKRLNLLVGLYPRSELANESMFRLGENYFSLADFEEAEAHYLKLLTYSQENAFEFWTRYKLAWAQFRMSKVDQANDNALTTLSLTYTPPVEAKLSPADAVPKKKTKTKRPGPTNKKMTDMALFTADKDRLASDALRLLSIMLDKQGGQRALTKLVEAKALAKTYEMPLYSALYDYYSTKNRHYDAGQLAKNYTQVKGATDDTYTFSLKSIEAFKVGKFDIETWQAKRDFIENYGVNSLYWRNVLEPRRAKITGQLSFYTEELAHLNFVRMQQQDKSKDKDRYQRNALSASDYYLQWAALNPVSPEVGGKLYLAAQATKNAQKIDEAIALYERSAYEVLLHEEAESAGYAALLLYQAQSETKIARTNELNAQVKVLAWTDSRVASTLNFAGRFPDSPKRSDAVMQLAEHYFAREEYDQASALGMKVAMESTLASDKARGTLLAANANYADKQYTTAAMRYRQFLPSNLQAAVVSASNGLDTVESGTASNLVLPSDAATFSLIQERLASAMYFVAESKTEPVAKASAFLEILDTLPDAELASRALFEASNTYLNADMYNKALPLLEHFYMNYPNDPLALAVEDKLIYTYELTNERIAAAELLVKRVRRSQPSPELAQALFQAADFYREAGFTGEANALYEEFANTYSSPFDLSLEARNYVYTYYEAQAENNQLKQSAEQIVRFVDNYAQPDDLRAKTLASEKSLYLAVLEKNKFDDMPLNVPLSRSLTRKRQQLTVANTAFEKAASYEISDIQHASSFYLGEIYQQLAQDILNSDRPSGLSELEREQYGILLEEQAYPFEEQAIELYRLTATKTKLGTYDEWIGKSLAALSEINPRLYARPFKGIEHARLPN